MVTVNDSFGARVSGIVLSSVTGAPSLKLKSNVYISVVLVNVTSSPLSTVKYLGLDRLW